jgi:hypothetical protein
VLGFAVLTAAILATGIGVARVLYANYETERPSALELTVAGAVLGVGLWVAVSWVLVLTHTLTRPALLIASALFLAAAIALALRGTRPAIDRRALTPILLILLPVLLWTAFIFWRGAMLPPVNHDALSYHLPKSVLFVRAHGFPSFASYDHRFPSFPANYEVAVADLLILLQSDRITEWIGTTFYLLFLLATALLAQRWWWGNGLGNGLHVPAAVVAVASAPVALLHSGTDKNDLMTQFFVVTALIWGARWAVRGGVVPMLLLGTSVGVAIGTKTNAGAVVIGLAPFVLARILRKGVRLRPALATVAFAILAFALCGGAVFVYAVNRGALMGVQIGQQHIGKPLYSYRMWNQLWEVPLGMLVNGIRQAGRDVTFSADFGPLPSVLAVLLPFAVWRYRREGEPSLRSERMVATVAALIAFVVILPTNIAPPAMPRYALFLLPLIVVWTIAPAVRELLASVRLRRYGLAAIAVLMLGFVQQAADATMNDASAPLAYVRWCVAHPGTRRPPHLHERASIVVDGLAGPDDTVALYGDTSTWIYPMYGAHLTRPVLLLPEDATPAAIPPAARWVAIERWWNAGYGGLPPLYTALLRDPHFQLVFENERFSQAVFRRTRS